MFDHQPKVAEVWMHKINAFLCGHLIDGETMPLEIGACTKLDFRNKINILLDQIN